MRLQDHDADKGSTSQKTSAKSKIQNSEARIPRIYAQISRFQRCTPPVARSAFDDSDERSEKVFNKKSEEATQIMLHVHKNGIGVCGTFTYEVAESKCKAVMDLAKKNEHPLQCTMEKS